MTHLDHLQLRLSNERMRLDASRSHQERTWREMLVRGIEREMGNINPWMNWRVV